MSQLKNDIKTAKMGIAALRRHEYPALASAVARLVEYVSENIGRKSIKPTDMDQEFLDRVAATMLNDLGITPEDWAVIISPRRSDELSTKRRMCGVYLREKHALSYPQIAKIVRGKYTAHASAINWCKGGEQ